MWGQKERKTSGEKELTWLSAEVNGGGGTSPIDRDRKDRRLGGAASLPGGRQPKETKNHLVQSLGEEEREDAPDLASYSKEQGATERRGRSVPNKRV